MSVNSSNKRPRKTKLVPRSFDEHDSNNSSKSNLKNKLQSNGTQPSSLEFSVDVEIEEFDNENLDREFAELFNQSSLKTETADDDSDLEHYFTFVTKKNNEQLASKPASPVKILHEQTHKPKPRETLVHYTFSHQEMMKELQRLTTSDNIADKMIEAEIRNNICRVSDAKFDMPLLHRNIFAFFKNMSTSKLLKLNVSRLPLPVSYKCYICKRAWWHLSEFLKDCESHTEPHLNIQIEMFSQSQWNLVLYESEMNVKFQVFPIDGNCWRCNKSSRSHFIKDLNICRACGLKTTNCYNLKIHEGICKLYIEQNCSNLNCYSCPVCKIKCWGTTDFGDHMMFYHDVRSDLYVDIQHKKCDFCFGLKFKDHFCKRWKFSKRCIHCMRLFQHQGQITMHLQFANQSWTCPICYEYCTQMCRDVGHMLQHTKNYTKLFKCLFCLRMFKTLKDFQDHKLLFHYVNRNLVGSQKIYVPVTCVTGRSITAADANEKQPQVFNVVGGMSVNDPEPSTSGVQLKNVDVTNLAPDTFQADDFVDDEFVDETAAIDEIISKRENKSKKVVVDAVEEIKEETDAIDEMIETRHAACNKEAEANQVTVKQEIPDDLHDQIELKNDVSLLNQEIEIVENQPIKKETDEIIVLDSDDEEEVKKELADDNETINENVNEFSLLNVKTEKTDIEINDKPTINNEDTIVLKKELTDENDVDIQESAIDFDEHKLQTDLDGTSERCSPEQTNYMELLLQPSTSAQEIKIEDIDIDSDGDDKLVIDSEESSSSEEFKPEPKKRKQNKDYACSNCGEHGIDRKEFAWHEANCNSMQGVYICKMCTEPFGSFSKYCKHFPDHGLDELMCPECGKKFEHLVKLCVHVDRHVKQLFCRNTILDKNSEKKTMYGCRICNARFDSRANFEHWQEHLNLYNPETAEVSDIEQNEGQASFETAEDKPLSVSEKNDSPDIGLISNIGLLPKSDLDECIRRLILPINRSTLSKISKCFICERNFDRIQVSKRHLVEHMLIDAYIKLPALGGFKCQICGSMSQRADQFKLHMRIHGALHVYKCEICDKSFSDSSNFTKHKKVHGTDIISCEKCPKKFQSSLRYDLHMKEHQELGDKGLQCTLCELTFSTLSLYKRHIRMKHTKTAYSCKLCPQAFSSLKFKWDHEWLVHKLRKGTADCKQCDASFRRFVDLKKHTLKVHDVALGKKKIFNVFQ